MKKLRLLVELVGGVAVVVTGIGMISIPAALIVAGLCVVAMVEVHG